METPNPLVIDYGAIARQHQLKEEQVRATAELLDEGNTVPFITRYRKDLTGGLDEEKIRIIEDAVNKLRQLNERKERVLRSVKSQEKLTPELEKQILAAHSLKTLDDLYLPFRPKKQTLATAARQKGLEPLALKLLNATGEAEEVETLCAAYVDAEKGLATTNEVLAGVRNILAENFSERVDVRSATRKALWHGQVSSKKIERNPDDPNQELDPEHDDADDPYDLDASEESSEDESHIEFGSDETQHELAEVRSEEDAAGDTGDVESKEHEPAPKTADDADLNAPVVDATADVEAPTDSSLAPSATGDPSSEVEPSPEPAAPASAAPASTAPEVAAATTEAEGAAQTDSAEPVSDTPADPIEVPEPRQKTDDESDGTDNTSIESQTGASAVEGETAASDPTDPLESSDVFGSPGSTARPKASKPRVVKKAPTPLEVAAAKRQAAEERRQQRREARHRKRHKLEQSFKDYFDYSEPIKKLPHYRTLALNRGERCKVLRVKIAIDVDDLKSKCVEKALPAEHPYRELLQDSLQDALSRLVIPSIEREVRRELTERAETHAVKVFAQNLRKLLLQAPLHNHRVLAIDPGFRSGCKLAALDEFGNVLGHSLIHVIGAAERVEQSRSRIVELVNEHKISVIAIGNGTACRETEQLIASVLTKELADADVHYLIVNEAGASVYSTSQIGRDELPRYDATVRGAVSIGRRALDPLSELVKIDPASIGVGLYQHDVKAKHLRTSLDAVVESCVNYVGVDVNSASPALLGYVSGLNQLTARRLYEYRQKNGPFGDRQELKSVPGIGEATFVQAAGFLKIPSGGNPLDATWIHPESYETAERVLAHIDCQVSSLRELMRPPAKPNGETDGKPTSNSGATQTDAPDQTKQIPAAFGAESPAAPPTSTESSEATETIDEASVAEREPADSADTKDVPQEVAEEAGGAKQEAGSGGDVAAASPQPTAGDANESQAAEVPSANAKASPASQTPPEKSVLAQKLAMLDSDALASELEVGAMSLADILANLARPGRDPREDLLPPAFRREILKLEELKPGMELSGTVLNVVDFGAFVDIGLSDSGLIHVSRLANHYVSDPHEVVSVGDVLNVWVVEVDDKRRRVSLTAIQPGTEVAKPEPNKRKGGGGRKRNKERSPAGARGKRPAGGKGRGGKNAGGRAYQPKKKPKPVVPITDAMERGDEPMRTFSDLQQFFEKKKKK